MSFNSSTRIWRRGSSKVFRVSMLQHPRQPVLVTDTENCQNHSCELVCSDEDTQNVPSCHVLKQTPQAATGVDLACQAPVQLPRTGSKAQEPTRCTPNSIPTRKQQDRVPALHPKGRQRSILARFQMVSTKWSRATLRCAVRRWEYRMAAACKSRVFLVACHGQMSPPPSAFLSLLEALEFVVQVDGHPECLI